MLSLSTESFKLGGVEEDVVDDSGSVFNWVVDELSNDGTINSGNSFKTLFVGSDDFKESVEEGLEGGDISVEVTSLDGFLVGFNDGFDGLGVEDELNQSGGVDLVGKAELIDESLEESDHFTVGVVGEILRVLDEGVDLVLGEVVGWLEGWEFNSTDGNLVDVTEGGSDASEVLSGDFLDEDSDLLSNIGAVFFKVDLSVVSVTHGDGVGHEVVDDWAASSLESRLEAHVDGFSIGDEGFNILVEVIVVEWSEALDLSNEANEAVVEVGGLGIVEVKLGGKASDDVKWRLAESQSEEGEDDEGSHVDLVN